jgi:hypothetical protein
VFGYISVVVGESGCVKDCKGLGLCKVGIVVCSVGDECEGGRGSLVTGLGRMGGKGESWEKTVGKKGQNKLLERRAMSFGTREG